MHAPRRVALGRLPAQRPRLASIARLQGSSSCGLSKQHDADIRCAGPQLGRCSRRGEGPGPGHCQGKRVGDRRRAISLPLLCATGWAGQLPPPAAAAAAADLPQLSKAPDLLEWHILAHSESPIFPPLLQAQAEAGQKDVQLVGPKPQRFTVAEGQLKNIASAAFPALVRLGSGALCSGYRGGCLWAAGEGCP